MEKWNKYLVSAIIYGILMSVFNLLKHGNIYDFIELLGNFLIYAISFGVTYFFGEKIYHWILSK